MPDDFALEAQRLRDLGVDPELVRRAADALAVSLRAGGKLLTLGNGGSAADAQHVAAELVGRFERERPALAAVALTVDSSALTAIGNDYGFDQIFSRQVEALGRPGDVLLAISTSGSSANVLRAVSVARDRGLTTIGLCGKPGCPLCEQVDIPLVARAERTASVQEIHLTIEHSLCRALEHELYDPDPRAGTAVPGSVVTLDELLVLRASWAGARRTVVWTNGVFDLVHVGHLASLRAARALGDVLVVGINSDDAVRRLKGPARPVVGERERAELLSALRPVDYVVVFDQDTPEQILDQVRPDVACKGADYGGPDGKPIPERAVVEAHGGRVAILPMLDGYSTTRIVEELNHAGA
jgi:phosphoheptose isomerase